MARLIGAAGLGTAGAAIFGVEWMKSPRKPPPGHPQKNRVVPENKLPGSTEWRVGFADTRAADDIAMQIKGFASTTSAVAGERVDFHVTVAAAEQFDVGVYRLGWYEGAGARQIATSPKLMGVSQPAPDLDADTGMISCKWGRSWSVSVKSHWVPGAYLAVFTTVSGWRSYAPFVVHDPKRRGGLCAVLPFSTYQAYNQWPFDGVTGKNLYYGYDADAKLSFDRRANQVSFDRPYYKDGMPKLFADDHSFIQWAEKTGFDLNYASTTDIESGRLDPTRSTGVIFPGHDEYWSPTMRDWADRAVSAGTSLAYLGANNVYWKVKFDPSTDGREHRVVTCYKTGHDPVVVDSATMRWRDGFPGPVDAEQAFLGVQYNGIVKGRSPLIVQNASHWFWEGCEVADGDEIPRMVGIEADGLNLEYKVPTDGTQTLLSSSPYTSTYGDTLVQNTSLRETSNGALLFVAGTLCWTKGLAADGYRNWRLMRATKNLLKRMAKPVPPASTIV